MADSGAVHKIVSVVGNLTIAGVNMDGRLVYTMVVAGIGIVYSICFCPPLDALFTGFPFDFILFIMWLVAFCLLETWRTVLAFSFIAWFLHLISGILGLYVFRHYVLVKDMVHSAKQQMRKMSHSNYTSNGYNRDSTNMEPAQEQQIDPVQPRSEV
ncbi:hypothetical protein B0T10DRAFT_533697 [Thelonectria olida]|uniref:Uncharacterized protein n=1 Tax=Thelonectria olida TaxID=1576542 RepID=A0A9P9AH99_9HYPO|nr:hypothetical protein B0T10DRAFT_533697 [Thelonectria olida]